MVHWLLTKQGGRFLLASINPEGRMVLYEQSTGNVQLQCAPSCNARHQTAPVVDIECCNNTMLYSLFCHLAEM